MKRTRSLLGAVALATACVLAAGDGRSQGEQKEVSPEKRRSDQVLKDIATAHDVIDYGRRHKEFKAMLIGIQMLSELEVGLTDDGLKVEGAGKEKLRNKYALYQLLEEVKGKAKAAGRVDTEPLKALIADTEDSTRNTPLPWIAAPRIWQGIALPTDKKTDEPVLTITRQQDGGQVATVFVVKPLDQGVPLDVRITDAAGKPIKREVGNSLKFEWTIPRRDRSYKIEIRNPHADGVLVKVYVN
jgi:hypothetical protein